MSARDLLIFPHEANINTAMIVLYLCAGIFHIAVFFCITLSLEEFIQNVESNIFRFCSR